MNEPALDPRRLKRAAAAAALLAAAFLLAGAASPPAASPAPDPAVSPSSELAAPRGRPENLLDYLNRGGIMMFPLYLSTFIALALVVERFYSLRTRLVMPPPLVRALADGGGNPGPDQLPSLLKENDSPLARIIQSGWQHRHRPFLEFEKTMEDAGLREVDGLKANVRPLLIIGNIAPLMGLLGTVFGMIRVFSQIAYEKVMGGKTEQLAGGIEEALITTAAGLVIAIPVLSFYHYFNARIDRLVGRMEKLAGGALAGVRAGGEGDTRADPAAK